jgi:hypothetical protein
VLKSHVSCSFRMSACAAIGRPEPRLDTNDKVIHSRLPIGSFWVYMEEYTEMAWRLDTLLLVQTMLHICHHFGHVAQPRTGGLSVSTDIL